jgi:hypothetical protein
MWKTKGRLEKVCIASFIQWTIQCTLTTNGTYCCWIWTIILDLKPWKVLTPSTLKQTNLEAMSYYFRSPCAIKEFMINEVKLLAPNPKSTYYTFNNNSIRHQSYTIKPWTLAQLASSMVVTSSQVREINLEFWTTSLITFKTSAYMYFANSQPTPLN